MMNTMMSNIVCAKCHNSLATCICLKTYSMNTTYVAPQPTPIDSTAYFPISPADFDKIRTLVHEEIEKALMDEEDSYEPRVVVIDGKPKIHIEFEYEGQLYAGDAYAVEKKYD